MNLSDIEVVAVADQWIQKTSLNDVPTESVLVGVHPAEPELQVTAVRWMQLQQS